MTIAKTWCWNLIAVTTNPVQPAPNQYFNPLSGYIHVIICLYKIYETWDSYTTYYAR